MKDTKDFTTKDTKDTKKEGHEEEINQLKSNQDFMLFQGSASRLKGWHCPLMPRLSTMIRLDYRQLASHVHPGPASALFQSSRVLA
jgi:hypothetical protein